jgi:pimeloyl-ACP methyl ester carboxylesterase
MSGTGIIRHLTGDSAMAEDMPGDPGAGGRFVRLDDGDMHVVEDGRPGAPGVLLIHGTAGSTAWWDPVVPALAGACRVTRVDLLGHGSSSSPAGGYDIPAHARRVGAALDRLGAGRVTVIGHSMGCMVATALAEQRPDKVAALGLIDMGPSLDAAVPEGLLVRLLLARFPGRLLWRLRSEATIRKAMSSAFTRPVDLPSAIIEATLGMTHRALAGTARGSDDYMREQGLPGRLAALGVPALVIFGTEDARYPSSSAAAYRVVPGARVELLPGVGHTPMLEDPQATSTLLLEFAVAAAHPR